VLSVTSVAVQPAGSQMRAPARTTVVGVGGGVEERVVDTPLDEARGCGEVEDRLGRSLDDGAAVLGSVEVSVGGWKLRERVGAGGCDAGASSSATRWLAPSVPAITATMLAAAINGRPQLERRANRVPALRRRRGSNGGAGRFSPSRAST
jgi:hypothetical protein